MIHLKNINYKKEIKTMMRRKHPAIVENENDQNRMV